MVYEHPILTRLTARMSVTCLINNGRLFYDEIIFDVFDSLDAASYLARLIDSRLRINEAAQLNDAFSGLDADLKMT